MDRISDYFKDTEYVHCYRATKYCEDVVSGEIPAGKYTRLACKRQLDDLVNQTKYKFHPGKAERICRFIESLPHTKGKWAKAGLKIKLEPWQSFILSTPFGWIDGDGYRRFTEIYDEIPRKNGKSVIAAGIGLYMQFMDDEYGAEIYCGATNEVQAWEVFRPAKRMVRNSPKLIKRFGIQVNAKSIVSQQDGSRFLPVIGKPGDGASPSCWICDEYHEHPDSKQKETAETGMGSRDQPMLLVITTAGDDQFSACYESREDLVKVLEGSVIDDNLFGVIYHLDEGDDWADPASLRKANPNMGVSVSEKFLLRKQKNAVDSPHKQNSIRTKHFNEWVGAKVAYFNMQKWKLCGTDDLKVSDYVDYDSFVSADLSSHVDFTCVVHVFTNFIGDKRHYYIFPEFYIPQSAIGEDKTGKYKQWQEMGCINVCDGDEIDFQKVEEDISDLWEKYHCIKDVCYDPHKAQHLSQRLRQNDNVEMVEYRQTVLNISQPMKELEAAINSGRLHHNNHPVMNWMISNVIAKEDRKSNVYPNKQRRENKIDGPVALIMAIGRATVDDDSSVDDASDLLDVG